MLHVKLSFLLDFPAMKAVAAQGIALVLFLQRWLFEWNDIAHCRDLATLCFRPGIAGSRVICQRA